MKKILLTSLILLSGLVFVACDNGNNDYDQGMTEPITETTANVVDPTIVTSGELDDINEGTNDESDSGLNLSSVIQAFQSAGFEVDPNERPLYQMLQASNGVIFYIDGMPVSIYEFYDEEYLATGLKLMDELREELIEVLGEENVSPPLVVNGLLAIETSNQQAIDLFVGLD